MSYARCGSTGTYIYPDGDNVVFDNTIYVQDDKMDIFLYQIVTDRFKEFMERLQHGKTLIKQWKEQGEE
jgi:hypothetical protein